MHVGVVCLFVLLLIIFYSRQFSLLCCYITIYGTGRSLVTRCVHVNLFMHARKDCGCMYKY